VVGILGFTQGKAGETRWADHWFEAQVPSGIEARRMWTRHRYLKFDWIGLVNGCCR
jgi:hypothetical protein